MTPTLSVVVANSGRARSLGLTLDALHRQRGIRPEIVVVSDAPAPRDLRVRWLRQAEPNVAAARNAGLAVAGGEIVAFCDDDAVPEPDWALRLLRAFDDAAVAAAGGPVLGPDGVRVQWGEMFFDRAGRDRADGPLRKLNGTNMAVRREALAAIGGFDARFAYYLDETDMLLRLADAGHDARWVPEAVVHHAAAPNAVRGAATEAAGFAAMGRSVAAFAGHCGDAALREAAAADLRAVQRARLMRLHDLGLLSGAEVAARLAALTAGMAHPPGAPRTLATVPPAPRPGPQERPEGPRLALAPRILGRRAFRRLARDLAARGVEVTLITQTWLNRPMRVHWHGGGYFDHRGGVFRDGNSIPDWAAMLHREIARVADRRAFTHIVMGTRRGGARVARVTPGHPLLDFLQSRDNWTDMDAVDAKSVDLRLSEEIARPSRAAQ